MNTYKANINAIKQLSPNLYKKLEQINEMVRFEPFSDTPNNPKSINIFDHQNSSKLYEEPEVELGLKLTLESEKFKEPYIYCFGIGNGSLAHMLLQQSGLKQLVVIEPEVELFFAALNIYNFTKELKEKRLVLLLADELDESQIENRLSKTNAVTKINHFEIVAESNYYLLLYSSLLDESESLFKETIKKIILKFGNNINDSLKGMRQTFNNIPLLLQSMPISSIANSKPSKTAIIISTGPSLNKQLPLLKEVAPYATLISVDASLPILENYDIKPDICISMERDKPTAKFFKQTSSSFKEGVLFVCASVQHPVLFEALKGQNISIFLRRNSEYRYLGLDSFGYLGYGFSAANFAHDLAHEMGMEEAVLIGQDLAFGEGDATHAKGHIIKSNPSIEREISSGNLFEIEGYGGNNLVSTNIFWKLFLDSFVESIELYGESMRTINSTGGGARIPKSTEIPFVDIVKKLKNGTIKQPILKRPAKVKPNKNLMKKYYKKVNELHLSAKKFSQKITRLLNILQPITSTTNKLKGYEKLGHFPAKSLNLATNEIKEIRSKMDLDKAIVNFFMPLLMPDIMHLEIACQDAMHTEHDNRELQIIEIIQSNEVLFSRLIENLLKVESMLLETLKELSDGER